jgi:hypothetical protein
MSSRNSYSGAQGMYGQQSGFGGMQGSYAQGTQILPGAAMAAQAQTQLDSIRDQVVEERRIGRELGLPVQGGPTFGEAPMSPGGTNYGMQSPGGSWYSQRSPGGSYRNPYHNVNSRTHSNRRHGDTVGQAPSGNQPGHPFTGNGSTGSLKDPQNAEAYYVYGQHNRSMQGGSRSPRSFGGYQSPGGNNYGYMSPGGTMWESRSPGGTYGGRSRRSSERRGYEAPFSSVNTGMPAGSQPGHPFTGNGSTGGFAQNPMNEMMYEMGAHNRQMQKSPVAQALSGEGNPNRAYKWPTDQGQGQSFVLPSNLTM